MIERIPYRESGEFGYTSDPARLEGVRQFVADAVRDGWSIGPTYPGGEPQERAATLTREGPDGLAIRPPPFYDFSVIAAGVRHCEYCGADDVGTQRVGFAGRTCAACRPEQAKIQEYPGWSD